MNHKPYVVELFHGDSPAGGKQLWRFRIIAGNGEKVGMSESYHNHADALDIAQKLRDPGRNGMRAKLWPSDKDGLYYWHVQGANGRIVLQSEGYKKAADAGNTLAIVLSLKPGNTRLRRHEL